MNKFSQTDVNDTQQTNFTLSDEQGSEEIVLIGRRSGSNERLTDRARSSADGGGRALSRADVRYIFAPS